tara:strand:+ start:959 stop:1228 length:270 start_codon:yes stop_codon:yes gene_type:complete
MKTFDRHKKNLREIDGKIYSYDTHVATIVRDTQFEDGHILQHGWWSVTTQRHINYVANYYDIPVIKEYEQAEKHTDELADRYYNIIKKI